MFNGLCLNKLFALPFNSRDRQNFGAYFKRFKSYNSPATIATELFIQSTDSESLLVSILKKVV